MSAPTPRVVVLQLAMEHYRQHFLDAVAATGDPVRFLVGDRHFGSGVRTRVDSPMVTRTGANRFLLGRRVVWQPGALLPALRAPVCVVELNPRNLTSWAVVVVRRLLGRRTVAWGHAWPRQGRGARSDRLRGVMRSAADRVVVYTRTDAADLAEVLPGQRVFSAPNSLYAAAQMRPAGGAGAPAPHRLLWIGRAVPEKKPLLALRGFEQALDRLPADVVLTVVGDGSELPALQAAVAASPARDRVETPGSVTDLAALQALFGTAICCVATGYVGLNVTQSLGFGVPVVYPDREPHAPELEALHPGNSWVFPADDAARLADCLVDVAEQRAGLQDRRDAVSEEARKAYSAEAMAEGFLGATVWP